MENTKGLNAVQQQFLCQDLTQIYIIPKKKIEKLTLIVDTYGPYEEGIQYKVPLWLAIHFKTTGLCDIVIPMWLRLEELKETYQEETEDSEQFSALPYYYQEIAYTLMKYAPDNFTDLDQISSVLDEIRHVRMNKLRAGIRIIDAESATIMLNNVGATEITIFRECIIKLFESINTLTDAVNAAENVDYSHNLLNVNVANSQD